MKVIIYCRVSSKEQEETGYSLDAQEEMLRDHAIKKSYVVAKVYKVTESASKWQIRKTLGEMLTYAEKNGIEIILVEKIDRLTRSLKDAAIVDDWVHDGETREVHFVKEHFVLNRNTKAHENFVWDMKVAVARFYTNNLSEEVKKGQAEKLRQGSLPTKPPPGYQTIGDKGHKVHVLNESTAPIIKKMFDMYASGNYSMKALTAFGKEEGLRTRTGHCYGKSQIESMLKDPFYYGAVRWNGKIQDVGGTHPPLITKEVFDKIQDVRTGKKPPHYNRHQFQFRKMLTCGECGGTITAEIKKGLYVYYHCNHYRDCSQKTATPEKIIEDQLFGVFKFFESITSQEAEVIKTRIKQNHAQEIEYKENVIKTLNERYGALQRRLDNLYNDRLDEKITVTFWQTKQKEITDEQAGLQEQLTKLKSEEAKYFEIWLNIVDLARRAREIYEKRSPEQRRILLSHIFSNLMLKDDNVIPTLKKSTGALAKRVQQRLDSEKSFELSKKRSTKGQSDSFESLHPALLALADDFRTIDWVREYPFPTIALKEIRDLLIAT